MFCSKCGAENPDDSKFCQKCGAALAPSTPGEAKPTAAATGLQPNVAGLICYVLGWITGLIFLLIEKENRFVRFHAMQSIVTFGALTVVDIVLFILSFIPFIGILFVIVSILMSLLGLVIWILLMVKAYQGQMYKLPVAGNYAEKCVAAGK